MICPVIESLFSGVRFGGTIFLNARSKASSSVSAPTSLAVAMKRFDCSGSRALVLVCVP